MINTKRNSSQVVIGGGTPRTQLPFLIHIITRLKRIEMMVNNNSLPFDAIVYNLSVIVKHNSFLGNSPYIPINNFIKESDKMAQYVITDGTRWIMRDRKGKYVPTSCEALADVYSNKQANSIFQNQLSKALKTRFHLEKIDEVPALVKQVTQERVQSNTEKVAIAENIQYWVDKVSDLNGLASEALHRKDDLLSQLSKVDQELSDIDHYIEFVNLNAAQGYKAYKMIKDRRIIRRSIKNELDILNIILGKKISETATDEIQKAVSGMDNRKYEPRVLNELFDF